MKTSISNADQKALGKLSNAYPMWVGQGRAGELTGLPEHILLHAGPPFSATNKITAPILNSAKVAAVYQGLANDFNDAEKKILGEEIILQPAQDHGVATPLASVVSMSMSLHIVRDKDDQGVRAFAPINGGNGPAMRLGICNQHVLDHLHWLNGEFTEQLGLEFADSVNTLDIARQSLEKGDDCHGRTIEATRILSSLLRQRLDGDAQQFLANGPSFFLNLWMASVKCMLRTAEGIEGSSLVTSAAANGLETGIQLSGLAGKWFTDIADPPNGSLDVETDPSRKLGAIGDSALVDVLGLGAMAMNFSMAQQSGLGKFMPEDGLSLPAKLLGVTHPGFGTLNLRVGTLAKLVMSEEREPVVSLGILDNKGELGRLGGGIFVQPRSIFEQSVNAL